MNMYLITRNEAYMKEIIERLNFEIVLVGRGYFPDNTCIWMGWQTLGDVSNEKLFEMLDARFGLEKKGIFPVRSTIFPENIVWDNAYGDILIFGTPEELGTYIDRFSVFNENGKKDVRIYPEGFIYKMECEIDETMDAGGKMYRRLKVIDRGFLYESDK